MLPIAFIKDNCSPNLQVTLFETSIIQLENRRIAAILSLLQEMHLYLCFTSTESNCSKSSMKRQITCPVVKSVLHANVWLIYPSQLEQRHSDTCPPMLGPWPGFRNSKGWSVNTPSAVLCTPCFCAGRQEGKSKYGWARRAELCRMMNEGARKKPRVQFPHKRSCCLCSSQRWPKLRGLGMLLRPLPLLELCLAASLLIWNPTCLTWHPGLTLIPEVYI